jgi:nucleoside-diphosphate-sugar epimerase
VGEFVTAVGRILERPATCQGEILNLGNPLNDVTIRGLARALAKAFAAFQPDAPPARLETVDPETFYGPGYDDSVVRIPSIAKATRLLRWRPRRTLAEMLPGIVSDYVTRYAAEIAASTRGPVRARRASAGRGA